MAFRGLDLQRVTEAFSFGLIQGRLSGDVSGLELQNWSPVAMDWHFYTPVDDKSQHRISQRDHRAGAITLSKVAAFPELTLWAIAMR